MTKGKILGARMILKFIIEKLNKNVVISKMMFSPRIDNRQT